MVSSKSLSRSYSNNRMIQKVVIPRGAVDPEDTIVIEIPSKMQSVPVLLAKRQSPELQETMNSRWNLHSFFNYEVRKDTVYPETKLSIDACLQTSATEMDKTSQVDPINFPMGLKYASTYRQSLTDFWAKRVKSAQNYLRDRYSSVSENKPATSPLDRECRPSNSIDVRDDYGVGRLSSPCADSESYVWTKHECSVHEEWANLNRKHKDYKKVENDDTMLCIHE